MCRRDHEKVFHTSKKKQAKQKETKTPKVLLEPLDRSFLGSKNLSVVRNRSELSEEFSRLT